MQHAVANVASVTSPLKIGFMALPASPVAATMPAKSTPKAMAARATTISTAPPSDAAGTQPSIPLGLLMAVQRPSADNATASTDYAALANALRSGNLASAQQAYRRLQNDLLLAGATLTASNNASAHAASRLNVTA